VYTVDAAQINYSWLTGNVLVMVIDFPYIASSK